MTPSARRVLVAFCTPILAVVLGGLYALLRRGGTHELPAFFVWSLPLGVAILLFARRSRFLGLPQVLRAIATGLTGFLIGVAWTVCGWLILGGWMGAWDFPVLFCWTVAASSGALAAAIVNGALSLGKASAALFVVLVPLAVLWWHGARPWPAVLVVYRDNPRFDAAQRVLDSVLTEPHPSGQGRDIRWPSRSYLRTRTSAGETAALIALDHAKYRDSIRAALAGNPLVVRVVDTVMSH